MTLEISQAFPVATCAKSAINSCSVNKEFPFIDKLVWFQQRILNYHYHQESALLLGWHYAAVFENLIQFAE